MQVFAALANLIGAQQNTIDLTDAGFLNQLVTASAQSLNQLVDPNFVSNVASIVAASNSALGQDTSQFAGQALIDGVSGIERLAQGSISDGLQQTAADPSLIGIVAGAFTSSNLSNALTPPTNGGDRAPSLASDSIASHGINELAHTTGSSTVDSLSGMLLFTDADVSDTHAVSAALDQSSVHWTKADGTASSITVPSALYSALATGIQTSLISDSTSGKIGEIWLEFRRPGPELRFPCCWRDSDVQLRHLCYGQ